MVIDSEIRIDATAERVWEILVDTGSYPEWNPFTPRIDGDLQVGSSVKLHVRLGGQRVVRRHDVSRVTPCRELGWTIRSRRPWLLRGERVQCIEEIGDGSVWYRNIETVEGVFSGVVSLLYGRRIRTAIQGLEAALKTRAEEDPG